MRNFRTHFRTRSWQALDAVFVFTDECQLLRDSAGAACEGLCGLLAGHP